MEKNHYQVLGVATDAGIDAIRHAHSARRKQFAANPEAVAKLDAVLAVLADPRQRQDYDRQLRHAITERVLEAPREAARPRASLMPLLLVAAVISAEIAWQSTGRVEAKAAPLTVAAGPAVAPPGAAEVPATEATAVAPPTPAAILAATAHTPAPAPAQQAPKRPEKSPGFDAAYMAWSVYLVGGAKGRGSGVLVERDKLVTNCHVIAGSYLPKSIVAINSITRERFYPEKIAILSDTEDVCLLSIPGAPDYAVGWGSTEALKPGAETYTVNFPGDEGLGWSSGNLAGREQIGGVDVLLTTNYCRPGVSGGPLFDSEGRLIGITSAGRTYRSRSTGESINGECLAVTAETARQVVGRTLLPIVVAPVKYEGVWAGR